MNNMVKFTFIGGDFRQLEMMNILRENGFEVKAYGFDNIKNERIEVFDLLCAKLFQCDVLMLPIPYKDKNGYINIRLSENKVTLNRIMDLIDPSTLIVLGKADQVFINMTNQKNIKYYDITEDETFAILNSIPSAEGAIQRAMEKTKHTIHGSNVLVLGYGRLGKCLARMLKGIGANVTVEARKRHDLAWIEEAGYKAVHLDNLDTIISLQQIIFNTIPDLVLHRERLTKINRDTLIIDLASYPGGTDFAAAKEMGIQAYLELGLPGIVAPKTSAQIICRVVMDLLKENSLL